MCSEQKILGVFLDVIEQNMVNSTNFYISLSFSAGPSLASLAIVYVLLFKREDTCSSPKPGHQRAQDLIPGPSLCEVAHLWFPSFPTHTSHPFIGKRIRKPRVTPVPTRPAHTRKRPRSHSSNRPKEGLLVTSTNPTLQRRCPGNS